MTPSFTTSRQCLLSCNVGPIPSSQHSYCFGCIELMRPMGHSRRSQGTTEGRRGEGERGLAELPPTTAGRRKSQEQLEKRGKVTVVLPKKAGSLSECSRGVSQDGAPNGERRWPRAASPEVMVEVLESDVVMVCSCGGKEQEQQPWPSSARSQVLRRHRAPSILEWRQTALGFWDSRLLPSTLDCCGPFPAGRGLRLGGEVGQTPQISRANFKRARLGGPAQECMGQAGRLGSPSHGMLP